MTNCNIEHCNNESEHEELGVCYVCYSGIRYWNTTQNPDGKRKTVAQKKQRQQDIRRLDSRMDYIITGKFYAASRSTEAGTDHLAPPKKKTPNKRGVSIKASNVGK